jgi:hypothetical protein
MEGDSFNFAFHHQVPCHLVLICPSILLSMHYLNTFSLRCSPSVRDQV